MPTLHKRPHPYCNPPYLTPPSLQRFGTSESPQFIRSQYAVPRAMSATNDFHQSQGSSGPNSSSSSDELYDHHYFNFDNTLRNSFPSSPVPQQPSPPVRNYGPDIRIDTSDVDHNPGQIQFLPPAYPMTPNWPSIPSTPPTIPTPSYTLAFESDTVPYRPEYQSHQFSGTPNGQISRSSSAETMLSHHYSGSAQMANGGLTPPTTPASQCHSHVSASPDVDPPVLLFPQQTVENNPENKNKKLYTHREQLYFFRHAYSLPLSGNPGPFIPQQMYKPHTNSDRRRYVEEVELEEPIYFWTENPQECGIPLSDALHSRVKRLANRDETVFEGRGPSVSIRLEWPGYRQWSRQIPTKDFRSPPGPITRAKLAKNVAKCVQRFILERQNHSLEDDADSRWRVGTDQNQIKLDDLVLVSIHHVSMGSWQPHLRLKGPFH